MKCIILAAGYATRLYPLTENFPKPLLKVGERAILDWLIDDLSATGLIDEYIVVTNHKFAGIFEQWVEAQKISPRASLGRNDSTLLGRNDSASLGRNVISEAGSGFVISSVAEGGVEKSNQNRITVLDDGTSSNETRLGAVRDIQFAIRECNIDDDCFVMAGDNLLSFSLKGFLDYCRKKDASCIMRYAEADPKRLRKSGIVEVGADDRVLSMEEKPAEPKSHWCCPPFYFYKREDLARVGEAIAEGCGIDAPGSLAAWLSAHSAVYAWPMPGPRYDIGNLESYEAVKRLFAK